MRAVCWHGKNDVRVQDVPDPELLNPHDAIVRITSTAICGSDLHLYDGYIPTMKKGDILGHEFMGEVVDIGPEVRNLKTGDRVVVPFTISCGQCWYCKKQMFSLCDNTNPNGWMLEDAYGLSGAGIYGYSHMLGGYAGGQAEYARVPFADVGPIKVPDELDDERVLFLSDIFPTGYQAAEQCDIKEGDVVAVWGCGPVGQFAIRSAALLGASKIIAIDHVPGRLQLAQNLDRVETLDFDHETVYDRLMEITGGRGADACIDAVGLEAHGATIDAIYDRVKIAAFMATDRGHALRQAIRCCRKGGTLSIPGVYGGIIDKFPLGAIFSKALTIKCGQTHVQKYLKPLLERIQADDIDPTFLITHRISIEDAPDAYEMFKKNKDECIKVVIQN